MQKREFTQEELTRAKSVCIVDYLEKKGYQIEAKKGNRHYVENPFAHGQKTTSFQVKEGSEGQRFVCYRTGKKGDIIQLVREFERLSFPEAVRSLLNLSGVESVSNIPTETKTFEVLEVLPFGSTKELEDYAFRRHIAPAICREYLKEVHFSSIINGQRLFALSIGQNLRGGYYVRNSKNKYTVGAPGLNVIRFDKGNTYFVFEGFFDFLAFLTLKKLPGANAIILNSAANSQYIKTIPFCPQGRTRLVCYLDNDNGGANAFVHILSEYPQAENRSFEYYGSKDYGEHLSSQFFGVEKIKKSLQNFRIDIQSDFSEQDKAKGNVINSGNYSVSFDDYGRLQTPFVTFPKALKKYIRHQTSELYEIDIKNSQPYFLGGLAGNTGNYLNDVSSGQLYEILMSDTGKDRDTVKTELFKAVFFGRPEHLESYEKKSLVLKTFKNRYPEVYRYIKGFEPAPGLPNLAVKLQSIESDFIINDIYKPLLLKDLPVFTRHDSLILCKNLVEQTAEKIREAGRRRYGAAPQLHVKKISDT